MSLGLDLQTVPAGGRGGNWGGAWRPPASVRSGRRGGGSCWGRSSAGRLGCRWERHPAPDSEEETWSGKSLLIFDSNWDGILSQAKPFYVPAGKSPKLKELGKKVEDAIKDAKKCIDKYRKVGTTTTYDDYSAMPVNGLVDGRECVVKQGYAVMQALVDLAKEVGVFDDCSPFHHNSVYTYRHEGEHPKGETGGV